MGQRTAVQEATPAAHVCAAPPTVWRSAAEVVADDAMLRPYITGYGKFLGTDNLPAAAAMAFKAYSWLVIEPAVTAFVERHRVVDMSLGCVEVAVDDYRLRVRHERLTVLPDDPMAGTPGVTVVPDEAALLDVLRRTLLDGHLEPAVEAFRRIRGGGARPLWGTVAQSLAYPATVAPPDLVPDRHGLVRRLLSILPSEAAALVDVAEIAEGGRWRPLLLRRTCCYAYVLPATDPCITCCLLTDGDRDRIAALRGVAWRPGCPRP